MFIITFFYSQYRDYSTKLEEIAATANCDCLGDCNCQLHKMNRKDVDKELRVLSKKEELKKVWTDLMEDFEVRNSGLKYDFLQQLSILELEAEHNGKVLLTSFKFTKKSKFH